MILGWDSWSLARLLTLLLGFGYFTLWIQIYLWHSRGRFHAWQMYIPVVSLPLAGIIAIITATFPYNWLAWIHTLVSIIVIVVGFYGGVLHWKSISKRTGGFRKENVMAGPPITLPTFVGSMGIFALLLIWY